MNSADMINSLYGNRRTIYRYYCKCGEKMMTAWFLDALREEIRTLFDCNKCYYSIRKSIRNHKKIEGKIIEVTQELVNGEWHDLTGHRIPFRRGK